MKIFNYIFYSLFSLYYIYCAFTPSTFHFIDNVNLIFHEAGHTIFFFLPEFLAILMGSAFQVLIPLSIVVYFRKKGDMLASSLMLAWAGQSVINVSTYARDAIQMKLELLGGESVIHDWNYIFTHLGLLKHSEQIGLFFYITGFAIILYSIANIIINLIPKTKQA